MKVMRMGIMTLSFKMSGNKLVYNIHQHDTLILTRIKFQTSANLIEMFELFAFICNADIELREKIDNASTLEQMVTSRDTQTSLKKWGMLNGTEESS